jgi:DNA-binding protein WhiA
MNGMTKCDRIILGIIRNNANRAANCDTGNIAKQINAGRQQTEKINALIKSGGIKKLTKKLQETAAARIDNPTSSYGELAKVLGITKSGVVNRIKKICGLSRQRKI